MAPSICQGTGTCDARVPHICYNGLSTEEPWNETTENRSTE